MRRPKKQQEAPVPNVSPSGQLGVSLHQSEDLKKTSFEKPMPNKPLRAPLAPMPKILGCPKLKIPEPPRQELLQQRTLAPSLKIEPAVCCTKLTDTISEWRHVTDPELRSKELLRQRLQNSPAVVPASSLIIRRPQREKWREMLEQEQQKNPKGESVPAKRTLVPPCSPQRPPGSLQGAPMPGWSTEAPAPRQKFGVETDKAPQINTSKVNRRTLSSLQPRTQLTRKRALDIAGVDRSPPQKKQRKEIKIKDQLSDQGSIDQMDYLCYIFTKCCVI
ncbi:uncharacterized protein [Pseudorasbora parva]|uniref:uncharacterized protein n=1 Tax=Pseudorasbora parva TaxID=51549 RepID=UPI00351DC047